MNMKKDQSSQNLSTRREFLIGTAGLALTTVLPACSQTAKNVTTKPSEPEISSLSDLELRVSCYWVARGEHENSYPLFKKTVESTTDFSWLSRGDRVLIKIALNSGKRYPAIVNHLKRMGGRPRSIAVGEINKQPDSAVID